MSSKTFFVTGIGTGIGKTIVSAILTEMLKADYWKPVQAGELDNSDTMKVKSLVSNSTTIFHPETYRLAQPFSPHKSAAIDGIEIDMQQFTIPQTNNTLIIEGAGGLMVPLNDQFLVIDLIKQLNVEVILVSQNYLGSINHTLLSIQALQQQQIPIAGIIFNGDANANTEDYILNYTGVKLLGKTPNYTNITKANVVQAGTYISL
jgi:dethiobiotin synthetase